MREFKGRSLIGFKNDYVAVDLETTGLDSLYDEIIEVSAIRIRNFEIVEKYTSLVKPEKEISSFITELTGITNAMLANAPDISQVMPEFLQFIGKDVVCAHNAAFDINFIYDTCERLGLPTFDNDYIDTLRLSRRLVRELKSHKLKVMKKHFDIKIEENHRAETDALTVVSIYNNLYNIWNNSPDKENLLYIKKPQTKAKDISAEIADFDETHPLFDKVCVFTGTLEKMQRKEAMQIVANLGGKNGDGVTAKTNYLILGNNDYCSTIKDGKSNKQKKAEALKLKGNDIEIISENVFYSLIEE